MADDAGNLSTELVGDFNKEEQNVSEEQDIPEEPDVPEEQDALVEQDPVNGRDAEQGVVVCGEKEKNVVISKEQDMVAFEREGQDGFISGEERKGVTFGGEGQGKAAGEQHLGVDEIPVVDVSRHFSTSVKLEPVANDNAISNTELSDTDVCKDVTVHLVRAKVSQEQMDLALKDIENESVKIFPGRLSSPNLSTKIFPCSECFKSFKSITVVLEHGKMAHGKDLSEEKLLDLVQGCMVCGRKFRHYYGLRKHEKMCKENSGHKKVIACKRSYSTASFSDVAVEDGISHPASKAIKTEQYTDSPEKNLRYPCSICNQVYINLACLRNHLSAVHNTKPTEQLTRAVPKSSISHVRPTCKICNQNFSRWDSLQNHMKLVHKNAKHSTTSGNMKACNPLKLSTESSKHIARNQRTCAKCSASYASLSSLYRHIRRSHGADQSKFSLKCNICSKGFNGQSQLQRHSKMLHPVGNSKKEGAKTEIKQSYSCTICSNVFTKRRYATIHVRNVHGIVEVEAKVTNLATSAVKPESPKCSHCGVTFSAWRNLYRHIKYEHPELKSGEKPTYCSFCKKTYANNECWRKHMRRSHSDAYKSRVVKPQGDIKVEEPVEKGISKKFVGQCHLCGHVINSHFITRHLFMVHCTKPSVIPIAHIPVDQAVYVDPICVYCEVKFSSWKHLYNHIKSVHPKFAKRKSKSRHPACSLCSLVFQDDFQLQFHNKYSHQEQQAEPKPEKLQPTNDTNDLVYPCNTCGKVLSSLRGLERHMRDIHYVKGDDFVVIEGVPKILVEDSSPKCKTCEMAFETWKGLYTHIKEDCGKKSCNVESGLVCCAECNISFRTQFRLELHNYHFHSDSKVSKMKKQSKSVETSVTSTKKTLRLQESQPPIICTLCDKEYLVEAVWFRHLRAIHRLTETKAQAMQLELSHKRPTLVSNVDVTPPAAADEPDTKAETTEYGSGKYKCDKCHLTTDYAASLKRHRRKQHFEGNVTSHGDRTQSFVDSMRTRSLVKPKRSRVVLTRNRDVSKTVKCILCHLITPYKNNLVRHYMRVHNKTRKEAKQLLFGRERLPTAETVIEDSEANKPLVVMNNVLGVPPRSMDLTATFDSDMSSSDSNWMHAATDVEDTSSSDSSSDDSDIEVKGYTPKKRLTSSSSSSSSSEDSVSEYHGNMFETKHKDNDTAETVTTSNSPSVSLQHEKSIETNMEETPLLKGDEILDLDQDIFVACGDTSADRKMVESAPLNTQSVISANKDTSYSTQDQIAFISSENMAAKHVDGIPETSVSFDNRCEDTNGKIGLAGLPTVTELQKDVPLKSNKLDLLTQEQEQGTEWIKISSVHSLNHDAQVDGEKSSTADEHTLENIVEQATDGTPNFNPASILKGKKDSFSATGNVVCTSNIGNRQSKNPPIAVLRPFSDVPDHDSAASSNSQTKLVSDAYSGDEVASNITNIAVSGIAIGSNVAHSDIVHATDASSAGANCVGSLAKLGVSNVLYSGSQNSARSQVDMSFPVFLVDSTDFIVPCFIAQTYAYRRISLALNNGQMLWYFNNWYSDLSLCRWGAIALLPKPLAYVDEIDWLIKWMLPNKIASLPFSSSRLPRLDYIDSSKPHMFTVVTSYGTIKCSAICCLCGFLLRDAEKMSSHGLHNHPLCTLCNKLKTIKEHHVCDTSKPTRMAQVPLVKFVRLSDPSSVNCKLITMTSDSASSNSMRQRSNSAALESSIREQNFDKERSNIGAIPALEDSRLTSLNLNIPLAKCHIANTATSAQQRLSADSNGLRTRTVRKGNCRMSILESTHSATDKDKVCIDSPHQLIKTPSLTGRQAPTTISLTRIKPAETTITQTMNKTKYAQSERESLLQTFIRENSSPYHCSFCDMWFPLKLQHVHHETTLHKKCTLCDLVFKNRKDRSDHITECHDSFICLACEKTCPSNEEVRSHIIEDHVDIKTGLYNCVPCGNIQIHPESIAEHLVDHDIATSKTCSKCPEKLSGDKRSDLRHFFSHSLSNCRSYCLACKTMYIEPWALRKHLTHANHLRACKFCLFSSYQNAKMANCGPSSPINQQVTAAARKWITQNGCQTSCNLCWKSFCAVTELREHCDEEHSDHAIQCEICGQRFQFDHQRAFHIRKHKKTVAHIYTLCAKCCKVECTFKSAGGAQDRDAGNTYKIVNSCSESCKAHIDPVPVGTHSPLVYPRENSMTLSKNDGHSKVLQSMGADEVAVTVDPSGARAVEIQVSMEHVQISDSDSGNVQLMLDGKLFNFVEDEGTETNSEDSVELSAIHCERDRFSNRISLKSQVEEEVPVVDAKPEAHMEMPVKTLTGKDSYMENQLPTVHGASCGNSSPLVIKLEAENMDGDDSIRRDKDNQGAATADQSVATADAASSEEDLPIVVKLVGEDIDSDDAIDAKESDDVDIRKPSPVLSHQSSEDVRMNSLESYASVTGSNRENEEGSSLFDVDNQEPIDIAVTIRSNNEAAQVLPPEYKYRCNTCTYSCKFKAALNKHMKRKHDISEASE